MTLEEIAAKLKPTMNGSKEDAMNALHWQFQPFESKNIEFIREYAAELWMHGITKEEFLTYCKTKGSYNAINEL